MTDAAARIAQGQGQRHNDTRDEQAALPMSTSPYGGARDTEPPQSNIWGTVGLLMTDHYGKIP
jgi:hypothetical protein